MKWRRGYRFRTTLLEKAQVLCGNLGPLLVYILFGACWGLEMVLILAGNKA